MAVKTHRSQVKRERNAVKDLRPSAKVSYARIPVQKACFVLDAIRGKDINTAIAITSYNPRYASSVIEKLLRSALANAQNNNNMSPDNLYVAECFAGSGPIMKRIHPRAQGRAYRILKRLCHITVILDEKNSSEAAVKTADTEEKDTKTAKKAVSEKKPAKDTKKKETKAKAEKKSDTEKEAK